MRFFVIFLRFDGNLIGKKLKYDFYYCKNPTIHTMNTSSEAYKASTILDMTAVLKRTYGDEMKGFIHAKMDDGKKYNIRCTEEMTKRLQRRIVLTESIRKLKADLPHSEVSAVGSLNRIESTKASVATEEAIVEAARKELKAREKSLVAAEKEAKKRGKTVSIATVNAVKTAREYLTKLEESDTFGSWKFLLSCLDVAEKAHEENQKIVNDIKIQLARMSAERDSIEAAMTAIIIDYVRENPAISYEIDI
jgi:hypothetical protein